MIKQIYWSNGKKTSRSNGPVQLIPQPLSRYDLQTQNLEDLDDIFLLEPDPVEEIRKNLNKESYDYSDDLGIYIR